MLNVDWVIPKLAHTYDTVTAFKVRRGLHMWVWCDTVLGASHRNLLSSSRPTLDAISSYGHPSVRIMITIVMIINAWRRRFRDQIDNLGDELRVFFRLTLALRSLHFFPNNDTTVQTMSLSSFIILSMHWTTDTQKIQNSTFAEMSRPSSAPGSPVVAGRQPASGRGVRIFRFDIFQKGG